MDIIVYGLMRSGTTLVADLLSVPGRSLVISEPNFYAWDPRSVARVRDIMAEWGLIEPELVLERADHEIFLPCFVDSLAPRLGRLDCWGIKQVNFANWRHLFDVFRPGRLILCVRDLRDIVLSSLDLMNRQLLAFPGGRHLRDEAWVVSRLVHGAYELMAMCDRADLVLRYEDLVSDDRVRAELATCAGLAELSADRPNLRREPAARMDWEAAKHTRFVSAQSRARYHHEPAGPSTGLADWVWRLLPAYSRQFGYDLPQGPIDHPYFMGAIPVDNPVVFSDTQTWNWSGPDAFDPAFARRRARNAAAEHLHPGQAVLDFGATSQALRTLLPSGADFLPVDTVPRSDAHIVTDFQNGDMPDECDASVITVLGALEFVAEVPNFAAAVRRYDRPVILTYHPADTTADLDRTTFGWANHLSRVDLQRIWEDAGFVGCGRWAIDGRQDLLLLKPK